MKKMVQRFVILSMAVVACIAQIPFYGRRSIGYPAIEQPSTEANAVADRFGNGETTTTQRLPIEALGDRALVNRLSKLPVDKQPFWLLNWRALEQLRLQHPTFQQSPSSFIAGSAAFNGQPSASRSNFIARSAAFNGQPSASRSNFIAGSADFNAQPSPSNFTARSATFNDQPSPSNFIARSAAFNGPPQRY